MLASSAAVSRSVVRHFYTDQCFEMKKVLKTSEQGARLQTEIVCLQMVNKSNRFVHIVDHFETKAHYFILYSYNESKLELGNYLMSREEVVSEAEARQIITGVAKALLKMHENKMVHRQVNHTSIMVK